MTDDPGIQSSSASKNLNTPVSYLWVENAEVYFDTRFSITFYSSVSSICDISNCWVTFGGANPYNSNFCSTISEISTCSFSRTMSLSSVVSLFIQVLKAATFISSQSQRSPSPINLEHVFQGLGHEHRVSYT